MRIDVLWTPAELEGVPVQDRTGVVIDVIRSATSVTTAIRNGARAVVPAASTEEALRIANSIGRDQVLLAGERHGVRMEGFDLGNSPAEFSSDVVGDRTLIMATTNGTRALLALAAAPMVFIAAFVNLGAVARRIVAANNPLVVCAGREGMVSVDDALCAGHLVQAWLNKRKNQSRKADLGDGAVAALSLARDNGPVTTQFLRNTAAGRALERIGLGTDIELCSKVDTIREVPVLLDRQIIRLKPTRSRPEAVTPKA